MPQKEKGEGHHPCRTRKGKNNWEKELLGKPAIQHEVGDVEPSPQIIWRQGFDVTPRKEAGEN